MVHAYVTVLNVDRRIQRLILQTPELPDLLRTILRSVTSPNEAVDDSDFEDDSGDSALDEGNEVVNLCRTALVSLKNLPPLEDLPNNTTEVRRTEERERRGEDGTAVEEIQLGPKVVGA
jgi:hypothetical protein